MGKEQRTPEHIIGSGLLAQLIAAGYQVVPARRSSDEQAEVVADPSAAFSEWISAGPKLAKAAGVYVGITVYDKDPSK